VLNAEQVASLREQLVLGYAVQSEELIALCDTVDALRAGLEPLALLEALAQEVSDHLGGYSFVDIPPPDTFTDSLGIWDMPDYVAVRWHPEDGFDYQLGIGGEEEMDKRHVSRELAAEVLTKKLWLQHVSPAEADEARALLAASGKEAPMDGQSKAGDR
jgi:hypothetical protein